MTTSNPLTRNGYLPKELPPAFSSARFAAVADEIPGGPEKWTVPTVHNLARPGTVRRRLLTPNPFAQHRLNRLLTERWSEVDALLERSTISASRPSVSGRSRDRGVLHRAPFDRHAHVRLRRMRGGPIRLRTDVAKFYPSVYTHAIEWATEGREVAKRNLGKKGAGTLGRELDRLVRDTMNGQTVGIPIGPDSSLILSELVLSACDEMLSQSVDGLKDRAWRWVDDLEVYTSSVGEAEAILGQWQDILDQFELTIAEGKTTIEKGPFALEPSWRRRLSAFEVRTHDPSLLTADLISLYSAAFDVKREHPESHVLSYAAGQSVRALKGVEVSGEAADTLTRLTLTAAEAEPSTLPYVHWNLLRIAPDSWSEGDVSESMHRLLRDHAVRGHDSETTWAMFVCLEHGLRVEDDTAQIVGKRAGAFTQVLMAHAAARGLVEESALSAAAERADEDNVWKSENWLVALELALLGIHRSSALLEHDGFAELVERDIGFVLQERLARGQTQRLPPESLSAADEQGEYDPQDHEIEDLDLDEAGLGSGSSLVS